MSANGSTPPWSEIITGAEFIKDHAPPDWLIDGVLQKGRLYACTSPSTHGKTAVWLFNSCMIQAGRKIAGLSVERGNVLYLAGENSDDVRARLVGMQVELKLRDVDLPYVLPAAFMLDDDGMRRLYDAIAGLVAVPLALIVVDTGAAYSPVLDENANPEQLAYARSLRSLTQAPGHPAVMALCHPTKKAGADELLPRGGSAFHNELDGNLTIYGEPRETATLGHQKLRGPPFLPFTYRLREVPTGHVDKRGHPEVTIIAEPMDDLEAASRAQQTRREDLSVLRALQQNPDWSQVDIANLIGWPKRERYKVNRSLQRLKDDHLVEHFMGKWQVSKSGAKFLNGQ